MGESLKIDYNKIGDIIEERIRKVLNEKDEIQYVSDKEQKELEMLYEDELSNPCTSDDYVKL